VSRLVRETPPNEDDAQALALEGYLLDEPWRRMHGNISPRTRVNYIRRGLPHLRWGGRLYFPIEKSREWIASQIEQREPPRFQRRRAR
jgi:hypothetical protein